MDGAAVEHGVLAISFADRHASAAAKPEADFIAGPENRLVGAAVGWLLELESAGLSKTDSLHPHPALSQRER
ncbi:MAG TPA: hypothetical protein VGJ15_01645, partial [Pirellulales bacterium]